MRVSSVNNHNFTSPKQQSFGAYFGPSFLDELPNFLREILKSDSKTIELLKSSDGTAFLTEISKIKLRNVSGKEFDPMVDMVLCDSSGNYRFSVELPGIRNKKISTGNTPDIDDINPEKLPANSKPFDVILSRFRALAQYFQKHIMPSIEQVEKTTGIEDAVRGLAIQFYQIA